MKLQDLFPGSFSAENFIEGPATLTIKDIQPIVFREDDEDRQKGKMTFKEVTSYWVFGKEAAGELAEQIQTDETDDWVGHVIELRQDKTHFKGKLVPCVRGSFKDVRHQTVPTLAAARPQSQDIEELQRLLAEALAAKGEKVSA